MTLEYDYVVVLELKIIIPQINEEKKTLSGCKCNFIRGTDK